MHSNISPKHFDMMQQFIEDKCGMLLGEEKAYLLESKLAKLLADSRLSSFEELYLKICSNNDPALTDSVIDAITINETFWFRDKAPWYVLEDVLLPVLVNELRIGNGKKARIWSAACSYGQEPYSLAMCIDNYLMHHNIHDINLDSFEIIATDVSHSAVQMALTGRYDSISIMRGLEGYYKEKYFRNEGRVWILDQRIRDAVSFTHFNLKNEFTPLGKFDVIFFRNVMIYFSDKLKKEMLGKIASSLKPGGILFFGSSELIPDCSHNFTMEHHRHGVYYRLKE